MHCYVVKHLGSGRALKREEETFRYVSRFSSLLFRALQLPEWHKTQQSTAEALNL